MAKPVNIIFMLAIPPADKLIYVAFLTEVSKLMRIKELREAIMNAHSTEYVITLFQKYEGTD
jgi:Phosphoenolpyruvate-dependent sugar phosphotransferase system, EIIA 2.